MGNRFNIRIGERGPATPWDRVSIKSHDSFGLILWIETTVNDSTFFKHYREVGTPRWLSREIKWASMRSNHLQPACLSANRWKPLTGVNGVPSRRLKIPRAGRRTSTNSHDLRAGGQRRRYTCFDLQPTWMMKNPFCSIVSRVEFNDQRTTEYNALRLSPCPRTQ